jgi:hypothetical protein
MDCVGLSSSPIFIAGWQIKLAYLRSIALIYTTDKLKIHQDALNRLILAVQKKMDSQLYEVTISMKKLGI